MRGGGRGRAGRAEVVPALPADTGRRWRLATALSSAVLLALLWVLAAAGPAAGHAVLVETTPSDGERLPEAPAEVLLRFDEPVDVPTGGVRVFDADAVRVDAGEADTGSAEVVGVTLPASLPEGGYVVVYRVVSTDSHPIAGVLRFTVGDAPAVDDATVGELFDPSTGTVLRIGAGLLRTVVYASTLLAAGAVAFAWLVAVRPRDRSRALTLGHRAVVAAVASSVLAVPVQGSAVAGVGLLDALVQPVLGEVLTSSFGTSTVLRTAALAALLTLWRVPDRRLPAVAALGAVAAASFALDGHQRTVEPVALLMASDVLHLVSAAVWSAGLLLVAAALGDGPAHDPVGVARLVRRFSDVALVSLLALSAAGVAMAVPLVGSVGALWSTSYGVTLLVKLGAVAVVLVVAAYNRRALVPAVVAAATPAGASIDAPPDRDTSSRAWARLRGTLTVEVVLVVVVLGVTAALVTQRPAAEQAGLRGIYEASAALTDDLTLDLVVDPNRVGLNQVHVYVLDAVGQPSAEVEDLAFELTYVEEGIGPIPIEPFFAGPGHWIANTDAFTFAGNWEVRVVAGIDRFTEASVTVTVPVGR